MKDCIKTSCVENSFDFESTCVNTETLEKVNTSEQLDALEEKEFNWQDVKIPEGYGIDKNGVFIPKWNSSTLKNDQIYICYSPIAITCVGEDIDADEFWYEITYTDARGQLKHMDVKQEDITKRSKVCNLANKGINVVDKKAGDLCEYFNKSIQESAKELPLKIFVRNSGWRNGQQSFVLGNRMFTKAGTDRVIQVNPESAKGLNTAGNIESWVDGVKGVISNPIVRLKCYCMSAALILKILDAHSFIVDHFGETSTGKSFGFKVAVSMFGNPKELIFSGDSTPSFVEEILVQSTDLPLFLDETTTQDPEIRKKIIYMFANEVGKGRANKEGGIRNVNRWKSVGFTTGEKPIIDSDWFGGLQVRTIGINREMPSMPDQIRKAEDAINENYGHVIGHLIRKVIEHKDELKIKYDFYRKHFTTSNLNTENRVGDTFAVIALAGEILEEVLAEIGIEPQDNLKLTMDFFNENVREKPIESSEYKALKFLEGWFEENRNNFVNPEDQGRKPFKICGYLQDHYIDIIPTVLSAALKSQGFDPSATKEKWIKSGILIVYEDGKNYKPTYKDENGESFRSTICRIDSKKMQEILEKEKGEVVESTDE